MDTLNIPGFTEATEKGKSFLEMIVSVRQFDVEFRLSSGSTAPKAYPCTVTAQVFFDNKPVIEPYTGKARSLNGIDGFIDSVIKECL